MQSKKLKSPAKPPGGAHAANSFGAGREGPGAHAGAPKGAIGGGLKHSLLRGTVSLQDGGIRGLPWSGTDDQVR